MQTERALPRVHLSRFALAHLSSEITGHSGAELDSGRFPSQDKPEHPNPIGRDTRQQIQNQLRIAVSIESALHQDQYKNHRDAKDHGVKVGLHKEFTDWNTKLAAHVAGQKEKRSAQEGDCSADRIANDSQ